MDKPLFGEKIAVLVANGFNEADLIGMQRMAQALGADMRIISMNHGLVNSWNGSDWGLNFAVDKVLNEALAADFTMLMMPGGQRSSEKLKLTAHTRRFVGGFMDAEKPVVAVGEAVDLIAFAEKLSGKVVTAPEAMETMVSEAGGEFVSDSYAMDGNLMSVADMSSAEDVLAAMQEFLVAEQPMDKAA